MHNDHRPIAAYTVTLVLDGHPHRILTVGRDEQAIRNSFRGDAARRARAFYDLDGAMEEDGPRQLTVEWGNVESWEVRDLVRGGTWARKAERPPIG